MIIALCRIKIYSDVSIGENGIGSILFYFMKVGLIALRMQTLYSFTRASIKLCFLTLSNTKSIHNHAISIVVGCTVDCHFWNTLQLTISELRWPSFHSKMIGIILTVIEKQRTLRILRGKQKWTPLVSEKCSNHPSPNGHNLRSVEYPEVEVRAHSCRQKRSRELFSWISWTP